jgi:uncharacterized membrane protein YbhN (UPF0104 family)
VDALDDLGLVVVDVEPASTQTAATASYLAHDEDGRSLLVKVYGRDAWDNQFLTSMWTALVRRGEHPHLGRSRRGQVEHEALGSMLAAQAGVPVLAVRTVGQTDGADAVLVTELAGTPLSDLPGQDIDDRRLEAAWQALTQLHAAGIAHGRVDGRAVLAVHGNGVALANFDLAELTATKDERTTDLARLLVTTATMVGAERAVQPALAVLGAPALAEVLPYLQPAALDRATRQAVKAGEWDLKHLRAVTVQAVGVEPPAMVRLQRVTLRSAAMTVGGALLAFLVVSKLANIDYASVWTELSNADWWWLAAALVLSPTVQVATSFSTLGASPKPLRYGPVLLLQYAVGFLAVALPSTAARLALEVRFFERFGLAAAGALSIGLIDSLSGLCIQVLLLLIIWLTSLPGLTSSLQSGASSSSSSGATSLLTAVAVLVALIALAAGVTFAVPRSRHRITALVPRARAVVRDQRQAARDALTVLRRPAKIGEMLAGNLAGQVIQAVILGLCLRAFGSSAHLSQLILVNTLVSLFAGLMPVPGGVGVAEAGYVTCLQAVGVPSSVALSAALAFRVVTFYLPPAWGSVSMGWLRRHQYV